FQVKQYFGGNGPGFDRLHMPIGFLVEGKRYVLVSSRQLRIIVGDASTWNATKSIVLSEKAGNYEFFRHGGGKKDETFTLPDHWEVNPTGWGLQHREHGLTLFGTNYRLGYNRVLSLNRGIDNPGPSLHLPIPAGGLKSPTGKISPFCLTGYIYYLDCLVQGDAAILFAHSTATPFVFRTLGGIDYCLPVNLGSCDNWVVNGELVTGTGKINIDRDAVEKAVSAIHSASSAKARLKELANYLSHYAATCGLDGHLTDGEIASLFVSEPGRRFCRQVTDDGPDQAVCEAAQGYYRWAKGQPQTVDLAEFAT